MSLLAKFAFVVVANTSPTMQGTLLKKGQGAVGANSWQKRQRHFEFDCSIPPRSIDRGGERQVR